MTKIELFKQILEIVGVVHDAPQYWLDQNEKNIIRIGTTYGARVLLDALSMCVGGGGRLNFFFRDFNSWRVRAENKRPARVKENAGDYYDRQGLAGSMIAKEKIVQEKKPLTEKEKTEGDILLGKLKDRFCAKIVQGKERT